MERKSWLCLDCHAVFYDGENHLCRNFDKSHFKSTRRLRHKRTEGIRRSIPHVQYNGGGQIEALNNLAAFSSSSDINIQLPTENSQNNSEGGNSYLKAQVEEHPNLHVPTSSNQNIMFDLSLEAGYPFSLRGTEVENNVDSKYILGMESHTSNRRHQSINYSNEPAVSTPVSEIKNSTSEPRKKKIKVHNYELTPTLHQGFQGTHFSGRTCSEEYSSMSGLNIQGMLFNNEPLRPESQEGTSQINILRSANNLAANCVSENLDMVPGQSVEDENEAPHLQSIPQVSSQTCDTMGNNLSGNEIPLVAESNEYRMVGPSYDNYETYFEKQDGLFKCKLCKKNYSTKHHFRVHFRIHTGERPYACDKCSKKFNKKCNLTRHLQIHSEERPYPCDMCENRYFSQFDLDNHHRIHSVERPYACHLCTYRFYDQYALNIHLRTHTGEKPYPCDMCDKRFVHKWDRDKHRKTHNGN